jgi:ankyrin repeat protein
LNKCLATENVDVDTIQTCLEYPQVDVNNALRQRAKNGNLPAVRAILNYERVTADVTWLGRVDEVKTLIDSNGLLTHAARSGSVELVKYLVDNGADLNCRAVGYPYTAASYAVTGAHFDLVKYFVEELHVDIKEEWQGAAIQLTATNLTGDLRNTRMIEYLLDKGLIAINHRNSNGSTLLHGATKFNQNNLVNYLLTKNANPFVRDRTGKMAWDLTHFPRDVLYGFDKKNFKPERVWFVYYNNGKEIKPVPGNFTTVFWENGGLEKRIFAQKYQQKHGLKVWIRLSENSVSRSDLHWVCLLMSSRMHASLYARAAPD